MRILVLSGGGSRGAFQAGVIDALSHNTKNRWDMIFGVSVGALNGAFLAQFPKDDIALASECLNNFWFGIKGNQSVYKRWNPFGKLHALWKNSLYDTSPLKQMVYSNLSKSALRTSRVELGIGAVCLETGEYATISGLSDDIHDWVLASSAFPVAFPPVKINEKNWVDGGVRDITPISDVFKFNPDHVDVILTAPMSDYLGGNGQSRNAIDVALRTASIMSHEVFLNDLENIPAEFKNKVSVYSPTVSLPDPLDFNPDVIVSLHSNGLQNGKL